MSKPLKLLAGSGLLLAVAVFGLGFLADGLAKQGIEVGGHHALGVATTVERCHVGLLSGTFSLDGLAVANPGGFGSDPFLSLGAGSVSVSPWSLLSDTVELPALELSMIRMRLAQGLGGWNHGRILEHLERFQGAEPADESDGKRFVIRKLTLTDVVVSVEPLKELGLGSVQVPIARIELMDVGSEADKGVLLSELAAIVVESILRRASATGALPGLVQGALDGWLPRLRSLEKAGARGVEALLGGARLPATLPTDARAVKDALG